MKNKILFLLLIFFGIKSHAQKRCANPRIDMEAMLRAEAMPSSQRAVSYMIRVYMHILKNTDGTNPAATVQEVQAEFQQLQIDYAANNICFVLMGVDSINNTTLNIGLNSGNATHLAMLSGTHVAGCLNIYYLANLPYAGGDAFSIPSSFCVIERSSMLFNSSANVTSHEVGHCLGLSHTFETAQGEETINRSNCNTAGDRVCDTPADPYSHEEEDCFSNNNCMYTGNCEDPNGHRNYSPPYSNIMSYWGLKGCSTNVLTGGQYSRINIFLTSSPVLLSLLSAYDYVYGSATVNSGNVMESGVSTLNTNGNVQLGGSVRAMLQARTVRLNDGFRAAPSGGKIVIKPAECNF
jgi:hypothetical protein